ncbi:N-acetylglucosamine kinase [Vibrio sp.]|nr:N-acetylglucosamine kinase [Vibrio sp.]
MITHLLAIDGGGTKTAVTIKALNSDYQYEFITLPSSLTLQGKAAINTIISAIESALTHANITQDKCSIAIGLAGISQVSVKEALLSALSVYSHTQLTSDAHISLLGAGNGQAVNCIAMGTGSVATRLNEDKSLSLFGGWGFPIGDQAGGAWLGFHAVQCLIQDIEHCQLSSLSSDISSIVGHDRDHILAWVKEANATQFATLSPCVMKNVEKQCPSALALFQRAVIEVERLLSTCCQDNDLPIVFLGSLGQYYEKHISSTWQARCMQAQGDAIQGALRLAHHI